LELITLIKGKRHRICALIKGNHIPVISFLNEQSNISHRHASYTRGLRTLMERYANEGRQGLTTDQCHLADKKEGIWEFRRGRLRIYFVMVDASGGQGQIVLLSHGIIKKHQKTKVRDKEEAKQLRNAYNLAMADGRLKIYQQGEKK